MHIEKNTSLKPYNTFGIDVRADYLVNIGGLGELRFVLADEQLRHLDRLILGGGSNILFTRPVEGLVLLNRMNGIEILSDQGEEVLVKAGAGEVWHDLVMWCMERELGG
ncbi:MAG: FAD-binding protein, partial [Bacteroidia bacterium]|nr:FAD-binding protein [Bacteroidia bacterium]